MDPVSQAVVGSAFAQTVSQRQKIATFSLLGVVAGMAPDLDVLIRSSTDPLLALEFHRQFTHSLVFIPVGALIVAAALYWPFRNRLSFRETWLACLLGYASHGLLDACTSYGTQLFWPFSNYRVSWNVVSVVDPLFTLPVLILVVLAAWRKRRWFTFGALAWAASYLLLGLVQHERATDLAKQAAQARGHAPLRLTVKPAFGNIVLWRSVYEHAGQYHIDAVRVLDDAQWCSGTQVKKLNLSQQLPQLVSGSALVRDIERFRWFSQDYLALHETMNVVVDVRYSAIPNEAQALWGIGIDPLDGNQRAEWWTDRNTSAEQRAKLTALLGGKGCELLSADRRER